MSTVVKWQYNARELDLTLPEGCHIDDHGIVRKRRPTSSPEALGDMLGHGMLFVHCDFCGRPNMGRPIYKLYDGRYAHLRSEWPRR